MSIVARLAVCVLLLAASSCSPRCPQGTALVSGSCRAIVESDEVDSTAADAAVERELDAGTKKTEVARGGSGGSTPPQKPAASTPQKDAGVRAADAGAPKTSSSDAGKSAPDAGRSMTTMASTDAGAAVSGEQDAAPDVCGGGCELGCNEAERRCNSCTPGEKLCDGDEVVECGANGQSTRTRCTAAADSCETSSCRDGACVTGTKFLGSPCGAGKCTLTGECVACLTAIDCPSAGSCEEATCSNGACGKHNKADGADCGSGKLCMAGACTTPPPKRNALVLYYNAERADNFTTGTADGAADAVAASYVLVRTEGYVFESEQPGTVPLKLYWSSASNDNFVTATAAGEADAIAGGYVYVRIEGYVYAAPHAGTAPLKLYFSDERSDNFSTGTADGEQSARAANYRYVREEGYVLTAANP